ncbi:MAG: hypothetical protein WD424_01765 [Paenibacillaceae bacterium]
MVYGLFIIGTYFCTAITIHLAYSRMSMNDMESKHYVLYTLDNQLHIEWIIRSLILFYWLQGESISITIIDEGSSDDTLAIVGLLSRLHQLDVRRMDGDSPQPLPLRDASIHIRLSQPEDMHKLPHVQSLW